MMDTQMQTSFARLDATLCQRIRENGFTMMSTPFPADQRQHMVYTIGLCEKGIPELILFSAGDVAISYQYVDKAARLLLQHQNENLSNLDLSSTFTHRTRLRDLIDVDGALNEYLKYTKRLYPSRCNRVMQLMWSDRQDRFPDEPQYDHNQFQQHMLT
jgi:hypothetical protein